MKEKLKNLFLAAAIIGTLTSSGFAFAEKNLMFSVEQNEKYYSTNPVHNRNRENGKWNIVFYQSGEYANYDEVLYGIILELRKLNWISFDVFPKNLIGKEIWDYAVNHVKSEYITFLPDGFYTNDWEESKKEANKKALFARKDVDLIIGAGTSAGQSLYVPENNVNTFIVSATDGIKSGFSISKEDSGKDRFNTHIEPNNFRRQVRIFYDMVNFKRLGVPFEDTVNGRVYAGVDDINEVAKSRKFEVVYCKTINDSPDRKEVYESMLKCFKEFATGENKVDAVYVTEHSTQKEYLKELAKFLIQHKIPNFSQSGEHEVQLGFMMSFSHSGLRSIGDYTARKIAKTFNGANPRKLTQYYEDIPRISINQKAVDEIGFQVNDLLKRALDKVYYDY